jgi:hypothetical protein
VLTLKAAIAMLLRRRQSEPLPPVEPPAPTQGLLEAQAARAAATDGLLETIHRGPEVREVVRQAEDHGRRNHFFDLLDPTIRGGSS